MLHAYGGSCPCGAVHFEVQLDLAHPEPRCGCPVCRKVGAARVRAPASAFRLTSGEDVLQAVHPSPCDLRMRCARCGVEPFALGEDPHGVEFVAVEVRCLDAVSP